MYGQRISLTHLQHIAILNPTPIGGFKIHVNPKYQTINELHSQLFRDTKKRY